MARQNKVNIVIPTFKRADNLVGKDYFKDARYVLPESQADDYRKHLPANRMIVIPDDDDGSVPRKRNWIIRNIPRPLLMIDDDVRCLKNLEGVYLKSGKFTRKVKSVKLSPAQAQAVIVQGFNLAHEAGCVLWGINLHMDRKAYRQYTPLNFTQVILGPFQGHLDHDLFFDERMGSKDDYDFSLQVFRKYGKVLRLNKYSYDCAHGDNAGGIVAHRTNDYEIKCCEAIMRKWGKGVIRYRIPPRKPTDLLNGLVKIPIRGM